MKQIFTVALAACLPLYAPSSECLASAGRITNTIAQDQDQNQDQNADQGAYEPFSPDQLDNLLAPIALYPDPLLAQVLPAATFPDQIDEAARFVRAGYDPGSIDDQPWDVSVKAVAHYPSVLNMMDDKIDWTTSVGQAYVNQSTDVMESIQRLRAMARSAGNLVSGPQQEVIEDGPYVQIVPVQPQFIYVPVYDPAVVYYQRPGFGVWFGGVAITFGAGFVIGAWLNRDCDWHDHRVFYHGWNDSRDAWVMRSRGYIHVTNVYVNNTYRNVTINRTVINRTVNVSNINKYASIHKEANFNNREVNRTVVNNNVRVNNVRVDNHVGNAVINRNINTNDPRLNTYRGFEMQGHAAEDQAAEEARARQQAERPPQNFNRPATPASNARSTYQPQIHSFGTNEGGFDAHAASQRGQASRQAMNRPQPARASSPPPSHPGGGHASGGGRKP